MLRNLMRVSVRTNVLKNMVPLQKFGSCKLEKSDDFEKLVISNKKPVVVDFFATWCGPCKLLMPKLEMKAQQSSKFDLVKIDVDVHEEIAAKMNINAVPTVFLLNQGKIVDEFKGLPQDSRFDEFFQKVESLVAKDK